jgi:hypothetical protein
MLVMGIGAALAAGSWVMKAGFIPAEILVIALGSCGLLSLVLPRQKVSLELSKPRIPLVPFLAAIGSFALLTMMPRASLLGTAFAEGVAFTPRATLKNVFNASVRFSGAREGQCTAMRVLLLGRNVDFESCHPPFDVVAWLHDNMPRDGVLLLNPLGEFVSMGLIPVRVAAPPHLLAYRNWEQAFPLVHEVTSCTLDRSGGIPFYAPNETPEQRYGDARDLGATLVLVEPWARDLALSAAHARPDLFGIAMDESQWVLLTLKPHKDIAPSCLAP